MAAPAIRRRRACASSSSTRSNSAPVQRALWTDLDEWSTRGVAPPDSQVPRLDDGTLVPPLPQSRVGFPNIPGVTYTGLKTTRYRFNYGPDFYQTFIPTINPPVITPPYGGQSGERPDLSELRAEDRQRRQRHRRHPAAGTDGAARDLHGLGAAIGRLGERRMRGVRPVHPVRRPPRPRASPRAIRGLRSRSAISPTREYRTRSSTRSTTWCGAAS